jgi:hypothetical protein
MGISGFRGERNYQPRMTADYRSAKDVPTSSPRQCQQGINAGDADRAEDFWQVIEVEGPQLDGARQTRPRTPVGSNFAKILNLLRPDLALLHSGFDRRNARLRLTLQVFSGFGLAGR